MATEAKKLKIDDTTSVTGYIHNVSVVKTSALKKNKYFNGVIQVSRDDFCDVVVFSVDKLNFFLQAQNCRSGVRLRAISKEPSILLNVLKLCMRFFSCTFLMIFAVLSYFLGRSGEGVDVLCGRKTDVAVVTDVTFSYREPPSKSKKTVAEIRKMSARQHVSFCFYIV